MSERITVCGSDWPECIANNLRSALAVPYLFEFTILVEVGFENVPSDWYIVVKLNVPFDF